MPSCNRRNVVVRRFPGLLTWSLWHDLRHPPAHPVFQRTLRTPVDHGTRQFIIGVVLLVASLCCIGIWLLIPLKLPNLMIIVMAMLALSSCYTVAWVIVLSANIVREHERGRYSPLCVSPSGAWGANWGICAASLHRADALGWIDLTRKLLSSLLLLILLMALLTTVSREASPDWLQFLRFSMEIFQLALVLYAEHVQAIVLGSLLGMLVPTYNQNPVDARVWGVTVFLTAQGVSMMVALLAFPQLPMSSILPSLIIFYVVRDGLIFVVWKRLAYQLNMNIDYWHSRESP